MIELTKQDFNCVGLVARHCNNEKLCIAIDEAKMFDFIPLICELASDVKSHWSEISGDFYDLINGSDYTDCGGNTVHQIGLKRVLVYYAYARYVMINNFDDTPNGGVTKTNDFSMPKPLKELRSISNRYRAMAKQVWEYQVLPYLCHNKDKFINFDSSDCRGCGCGSNCNLNKENTKGYGLTGVNIGE